MAIIQPVTKETPNEQEVILTNLRQLMRKIGINEAELSRRTQIPQATLHKILSGKTEDPRISTLKTLCDFFNISIDQLLTGLSPTPPTSQITTQSVPLLSWKDCAQAHKMTPTLTATNWQSWIVSEFISPHAYALLTKPSLSPRFPKSTVLFIDPDITPEDGDYLLVLFPNTTEATIREYSIDGPSQLLMPINPNTEITKLTQDIQILGVLVKSSFSY